MKQKHKFVVWLLAMACATDLSALAQIEETPDSRGSLAGQRAIEELKRAQTNEVYNLHYGRILLRTEARVGVAYTDNVFLSAINRVDDVIVRPEIKLGASVAITELNTLKL